jgi:hypothetical protein
MNISVNIGSSQDFRLSRALLVYGKSSYDGYPYRHPFVTLHEVIHDGDVARLAEGKVTCRACRNNGGAPLGNTGSWSFTSMHVEAHRWDIPQSHHAL